MTRRLRRRIRGGTGRAADAQRAAALVRKADARYDEHDYGEAMKLYEAAVEAGARGRAPAMIVTLLGMEEPEKAMKMANRLISREPENGAAYAARGTILARANMHAEAAEDYVTAARKTPGHEETYFPMGLTYSYLGMHAEAAEAYGKSVEMRPGDLESIHGLCMELENLGRYDEALSLLKEKERETGHRDINMHLGRVYGKTGDWKNAFANHVEAVRPPCLHADGSSCEAEPERWDDVYRMREWAEAAEPDADSTYFLAVKLLEAGWDENAVNAFDTAARMRPNYAAYMTMAEICSRYLYLHSSIKHVESALGTLGKNSDPQKFETAYEYLVKFSVNCGLRRRALDYSDRAARLGIKNEEIVRHRDAILSEYGENPEDWDQVHIGMTRPDWL